MAREALSEYLGELYALLRECQASQRELYNENLRLRAYLEDLTGFTVTEEEEHIVRGEE